MGEYVPKNGDQNFQNRYILICGTSYKEGTCQIISSLHVCVRINVPFRNHDLKFTRLCPIVIHTDSA